jgi:hypothetical protein
MPEARIRIGFPEATQEAFEAFADEVAAVLPKAEVTYQDEPWFGNPYIIVMNHDKNPWESYTLTVDIGQELCIGEHGSWVEPKL